MISTSQFTARKKRWMALVTTASTSTQGIERFCDKPPCNRLFWLTQSNQDICWRQLIRVGRSLSSKRPPHCLRLQATNTHSAKLRTDRKINVGHCFRFSVTNSMTIHTDWPQYSSKRVTNHSNPFSGIRYTLHLPSYNVWLCLFNVMPYR